MPDTMIERVARGMWEEREKSFPYRTQMRWEDATQITRGLMLSQARAALEAMREPTEAMLERADEPFHRERARQGDALASGPISAAVWSAMLSAAIEGL